LHSSLGGTRRHIGKKVQGFLHQESSETVKRRYKPGIMVIIMEVLMTKSWRRDQIANERDARRKRCEQNALLFLILFSFSDFLISSFEQGQLMRRKREAQAEEIDYTLQAR
jgi:hypothetical protein